MNESLSVGDVMRRDFVGVSQGDSVAGAAELMDQEQVDSALVVRGGDPAGILTASDIVGIVASGTDPEDTTAGEIMRQPVITVAPDDDLGEAVAAIADRNVRWLAVVSEGDVTGMVSEHDVLTAPTALSPVDVRSAPGPSGAIPEGSDVGLQTGTYSTQGLCEACGSLSRDLASRNGQLLCEDCLAM